MALPLSAGRMAMSLSSPSFSRACIWPFVMLDLGSLGLVKQLCTAVPKSAASSSATASVSAMMVFSEMDVSAGTKFNPNAMMLSSLLDSYLLLMLTTIIFWSTWCPPSGPCLAPFSSRRQLSISYCLSLVSIGTVRKWCLNYTHFQSHIS